MYSLILVAQLLPFRAVAHFPQLFYSYIGVSQITQQAESEKLALQFYD